MDRFSKIARDIDDRPHVLKRLAVALTLAVDESRKAHPMIICADRSDHKISAHEQNKRIDWCIDWMIEKRRGRLTGQKHGWTIERMCDTVGRALDAHLDTRPEGKGLERSWMASGPG